jgi:RING finger and CHY zinc finger domain-containing protein 1
MNNNILFDINMTINDIINFIENEYYFQSIINDILINVYKNSYIDNNYGCEHYKRKCKLIMPCCNKAFSCRICHDNEMYDYNNDYKKAHKLGNNRFNIKEIICQFCSTRQKKSNKCVNCNIIFGNYFCNICNLYDDIDKQQFHCNKCGICRVGGRENFKHCDNCNLCIGINTDHKCSKLGKCSICLEDLQTSRQPLYFLKCNHTLHYNCFKEYIKTNYKCPLCSKSIVDMTSHFSILDQHIQNTPLPDEYTNKFVDILCNDCNKYSNTKFHFIGLKCSLCNSYNTKQIKN